MRLCFVDEVDGVRALESISWQTMYRKRKTIPTPALNGHLCVTS